MAQGTDLSFIVNLSNNKFVNLYDLSHNDSSKFFITVNGKYGGTGIDFSCNFWPHTYSSHKIETLKRETHALVDSSFVYATVKDISFDMSFNSGQVERTASFTVKQRDKNVSCLPVNTASHELLDLYFYNLFDVSGQMYQRINVPMFVAKETAHFLIVGGGGSGGINHGAGGGGGGLLTSYSDNGTNSNGGNTTDVEEILEFAIDETIQIAVGNGGTAILYREDGNTGDNSTITTPRRTITAYGGGGGGSSDGSNRNGKNGGCGGGGGFNHAGGTGSQGYNGGSANSPSYNYVAAGGGGAGAAGSKPNGTGSAGHGGKGKSNNITSQTIWYAGGGGGAYEDTSVTNHHVSHGGQGGGGSGYIKYTSSSYGPIDGTTNTGGGGGGGDRDWAKIQWRGRSGAGGSGVVILRYSTSLSLSITSGTLQTSNLNSNLSSAERYTRFTSGNGNIKFTTS